MKIIHINNPKKIKFEDFIHVLTEIITISDIRKRESEFYNCGFYYLCNYENIEMKISESDDIELRDYSFAITIKTEIAENEIKKIVEKIVKQNFQIAIPDSIFKGAKITICKMNIAGDVEWA